MKKVLFYAISFILSNLLLSCNNKEKEKTKTIHHVQRILMHESGHFTFFYVDPPSDTIKTYEIGGVDVTYLRDVPSGEDPWIFYEKKHMKDSEAFTRTLIIHLNSVDQINGAGWDHGKFGQGQTVVIE